MTKNVSPAFKEKFHFWFRKTLPPIEMERRVKVRARMREEAHPDFDYFLLVVLSSIIATSGLLTNSGAVIIGAMLVAPLMSPIIGLGLGALIGDEKLLKTSASSLFRGAFIAVLVAILLTWFNESLPFITLQTLPEQVISRTSPTPIDLMIALAGGLAAAFAIAQPSISAALPGVAIATALMPPLGVVGIGIAMGRWEVAGGAFLLFITNAVTIAFASMLVFFALGFSPGTKNGVRVPRALWLSAFVTFLMLLPLTYLSINAFQEASREREIHKIVSEEIHAQGAELLTLETSMNEDGILNLEITLRTPQRLYYGDVDGLQENIALQLQETVAIVVNQIIADKLDPLVPPTFTSTPTRIAKSPTPTATKTSTLTPTPTATFTPTSTFTLTPTPETAKIQNIFTDYNQCLELRQSAGFTRPVIGRVYNGHYITIRYSERTVDGLVWLKIEDKEGRLGWLPEVCFNVITPTPTEIPIYKTPTPEGN